ncbi:MAG: RNA-binding protein [Candidatus Omnitrophota bacterium]|nr:MAG: RNA-binding protein [Candidatus Omnitrophota bacterium]
MEEEKKAYLGNLEYSVTEEELKGIIEEKGIQVKEVKVIKDRDSGRSKGFGFAEFETDEALNQAIEALDGLEVKGRKLKVNKARKQKPRFEQRRSFGFRKNF